MSWEPRIFNQLSIDEMVTMGLRFQTRAALGRDQGFGPCMIKGSKGSGKSALAKVIAYELGVEHRAISMARLCHHALVMHSEEASDDAVIIVEDMHTQQRSTHLDLSQTLEELLKSAPRQTFVLTSDRSTLYPKALTDLLKVRVQLHQPSEGVVKQVIQTHACSRKLPLSDIAIDFLAARAFHDFGAAVALVNLMADRHDVEYPPIEWSEAYQLTHSHLMNCHDAEWIYQKLLDTLRKAGGSLDEPELKSRSKLADELTERAIKDLLADGTFTRQGQTLHCETDWEEIPF